jgi:hypothetical protein
MFSFCECIFCKKLLYCVRAGVSTFQVLARHDSSRAHLYSTRAVYIPPTPVYILPAPVYIPPAPVYIPSKPVPNFQSTSCLRPCLSHRCPRSSNICKRTGKYRPRPWLCVRARRSTVRALEHPVLTGINAFAPEGSCETTAACVQGTISPRPFAMHSVQSPCTWACNYGSSCLLGTSWVRTKADFI